MRAYYCVRLYKCVQITPRCNSHNFSTYREGTKPEELLVGRAKVGEEARNFTANNDDGEKLCSVDAIGEVADDERDGRPDQEERRSNITTKLSVALLVVEAKLTRDGRQVGCHDILVRKHKHRRHAHHDDRVQRHLPVVLCCFLNSFRRASF